MSIRHLLLSGAMPVNKIYVQFQLFKPIIVEWHGFGYMLLTTATFMFPATTVYHPEHNQRTKRKKEEA
jgi:hypothetical protein